MTFRDGDGKVHPGGLIAPPGYGWREAVKKLRLKIAELTERVEKLEKEKLDATDE